MIINLVFVGWYCNLLRASQSLMFIRSEFNLVHYHRKKKKIFGYHQRINRE